MTRLRFYLRVRVSALQLIVRVYRLSRKNGIPFQPLLQTHLQAMNDYTVLLAAVTEELALQEHRRQASEQAWKN